jgi:hypothetical protein
MMNLRQASDRRSRFRVIQGRAPQATVEALMYSLRERGTAALAEPDTKRRLSELVDAQVVEVGKRLSALSRQIGLGPWSLDEIEQLFRTRAQL